MFPADQPIPHHSFGACLDPCGIYLGLSGARTEVASFRVVLDLRQLRLIGAGCVVRGRRSDRGALQLYFLRGGNLNSKIR